MRTTITTVVLGLALAAAACSSSSDRPIPTAGDPDLASRAEEAVDAAEIPALAMARVTADGGVEVGVAGTLSANDDTPVTVDAPFHLGSGTKAMTAVMVAQVVEDGLLDLDARIADVLPDAELAPSIADITVRDSIGHRTGLAIELDLEALDAATDPVAARRDAVLAELADPEFPPDVAVYSNVNFMLAGVVIEELTGRTWEELVQERIFDPLGMDSCGLGAPTGPEAPSGHTTEGTPVAQDAPLNDNPPALAPAGTVHCSISDWGAFVAATLQNLAGADSPILSAATAADLYSDPHEYVAGWIRTDEGNGVVYSHDGSNTLWYSRAVLRPERGEALLIVTNSGQEEALEAVESLSRGFRDG